MIKTIALDIGDVLVEYQWDELMASKFDQETADIVADAIWFHGDWEELDRGVLPLDELLTSMISHAPSYKEEITWAFTHVASCVAMRPYAIEWINALKKKGYRVLYLSNYSEYIMEGNREALRFLPYLDGGIFSYDVKAIKPEREIYEIFCRTLNVKANECIFIDDKEENVLAAKAFGLHAIQYKNFEQCQIDLEIALKEWGGQT